MRSLTISVAVLHEMIAACRRVFPREACGILGGRGGVAHTHYPLRNVAASPLDNFLGDPQDHVLAVRQMEMKSEKLVAIYHSHPQTAPIPSQEDIKQATYPELPYVIMGLASGMHPEVRTYLLKPEDMQAAEIPWYIQR